MSPLLSYLAIFAFATAHAAPSPQSPTSSQLSTPSSAPKSNPLTTKEQDSLLELHESLVNIPSISGDEAECTDFIEEHLTTLGYYVEKVEVEATGQHNVFAYPTELKDQGVWPETLISSHIDTVGPFIPFERREKNGSVYHYGRGTVDAKGCIAAQIIATHKFMESRSDTPSLGMLFVVSEETGGDGMKAFAKHAKNATFKAGIFGEPTEGKLATGHKGSDRLTIQVDGKPAHSAYEWLGISAINWLVEGIVALNNAESALPESELLGPSTLNVGQVSGGVAANVVPESANITASIRVAAGKPEELRDIIKEALAPVARRAEKAGANFTMTFADTTYGAQMLDVDVPGLESAPVLFGTDIPNLPQVEKRYLYGAGNIQVAHTANEELTVDELVEMAEGYGLILAHLFSEE